MDKKFEVPGATSPIQASPTESLSGASPIIVPEKRAHWRDQLQAEGKPKPSGGINEPKPGSRKGYIDPKKWGTLKKNPYSWQVGMNE